MGNACRELRHVDESVRHLDAAVAAAVELGDRELEGRASMSLAASLSYSGEFERSLELATRAVALLDGDDKVTAMSQRAGLLQRAGRHPEALQAFTAALQAAAGTTDPTILGLIWMNRGVLLGWAGEIEAAEADTRRALDHFESHGWTKRAADMRHNLAWLAARRGDLVESFRRFDDAEQRYHSLGVSSASVFPDRAEALLAAGLPQEALYLAERAARDLRAQGDDVDVAEALMLVARAALLAGDVSRAADAAGEAMSQFQSQGRAGWWAAAASLRVEAHHRAGTADESDTAVIDTVIAATEEAGLSAAAASAHVLAAELAADRGDVDAAQRHLAATAHELGLATRCRRDLVAAQLLARAGRPEDALGALRRDRRRVRLPDLGTRWYRATGPRRHARGRRRRPRRRPVGAQRRRRAGVRLVGAPASVGAGDGAGAPAGGSRAGARSRPSARRPHRARREEP